MNDHRASPAAHIAAYEYLQLLFRLGVLAAPGSVKTEGGKNGKRVSTSR